MVREPPSRPPEPDSTASAGGPLRVRGGSELRVASDGMLVYRAQLTDHATELDSIRGELLGILARLERVAVPWGVWTALDVAMGRAGHAAELVRALADAVAATAERYADGELRADRVVSAAGTLLAILVVPAQLRYLLVIAPARALLFALLVVRPMLTNPAAAIGVGRSALDWFQRNQQLVSNPVFATLVEQIVENTDDAVMSTLFGAAASAALGEHGLGVTDVATSAGLTAAVAAPLGMLRESPVDIRRRSAGLLTAPAGSAHERLRRIPDEGVVRIEKFQAPGEPDRYVVYVPPTASFSPFNTGVAADLASNVAAVAQGSAGAERSVRQAMDAAGVTADSPIQLVGFSQGAVIAQSIAASGDYTVVGMEDHGGPSGKMMVDPAVSGYSVRHLDDPIPSLGGAPVDDGRIRLERLAYAPGEIPEGVALPAHQREAYLTTAGLIDRAESPELRRQLAAMNAFTAEFATRADIRMTVSEYDTFRVSTPESGSLSVGADRRAGGGSH